MKRSTLRLLAGAGAVAVIVAGCAGAAHLKALQPAPVPAAQPIAIDGEVPRPSMQLGIDIDAYTYRGQDIATAAAADVAYIKSLHANSVSITFPFFMAGPRAARVYATAATPTPGQIAVIARTAEHAGLYVSIRPLLDEKNLGHARADLHLRYPHQWFASYRAFLLPYAAMAQRARVGEFIVGTELTRFRKSPPWNPLDAALRRVYHGTLAFDSNWWGYLPLAGAGGRGLQEGVDAYPPIPAAHLAAGWELYDRTMTPGTVESEVGIAAAPDAFTMPWLHHWPGAPLDTGVQAQWFTAACYAAAATHLGGIYFWSIGLGAQARTGPSVTNQLAWAGGQGAQAISSCFASIDGSSK